MALRSDSTTYQSGGWQTVDEIVVPVTEEVQLPDQIKSYGAHVVSAKKYQSPGTAQLDSAARAREDSLTRAVNDSLARQKSGYGIVLQSPYREMAGGRRAGSAAESGGGLSWVFAALLLLFCLICMKFKGNPRYFSTLVSDMKDFRARHNMFDNTVRESSFLLLLNVTWVCSAGVLLWGLLPLSGELTGISVAASVSESPLKGIGICAGVSAAYLLLMSLAYWIVGNVFSDSRKTSAWLRGAYAANGVEALGFFPLALLLLCYPDSSPLLIAIGAGVFAICKIMFIYKGFRIFFNQISSWLLFLYYLCSLEIVPVILTVYAAVHLCTKWI